MVKRKQQKFLKLYEPIHDKFEGFCRARVYGEMDYQDLMNETLVVAFEKFDALKSETAFLSFLFGISVRILANQNKKIKEDSYPKAETLENIEDVNANTEANAEVTLLYKMLSLLPSEQKEALILFEISGFSIKEISAIQNASESAVKQRLKRGREKLKELLTFESNYKTREVQHGK